MKDVYPKGGGGGHSKRRYEVMGAGTLFGQKTCVQEQEIEINSAKPQNFHVMKEKYDNDMRILSIELQCNTFKLIKIHEIE